MVNAACTSGAGAHFVHLLYYLVHSYTLTHTITSTSGRTPSPQQHPKLPTSLAGSLTHPHHFGSGAAVLGGPVAVVAG